MDICSQGFLYLFSHLLIHFKSLQAFTYYLYKITSFVLCSLFVGSSQAPNHYSRMQSGKGVGYAPKMKYNYKVFYTAIRSFGYTSITCAQSLKWYLSFCIDIKSDIALSAWRGAVCFNIIKHNVILKWALL